MNLSSILPLLQPAAVGMSVGCVLTYALRRPIDLAISSIRVAKYGHMKMAIVVRTDLPMTPGKAASQCSHAAVCCYNEALISRPNIAKFWAVSGQPKIVLQCSSELALKQLEARAKKKKLIVEIILDAGRTQLPNGTPTVIGIGPGLVEDIDEVTGRLKLY